MGIVALDFFTAFRFVHFRAPDPFDPDQSNPVLDFRPEFRAWCTENDITVRFASPPTLPTKYVNHFRFDFGSDRNATIFKVVWL